MAHRFIAEAFNQLFEFPHFPASLFDSQGAAPRISSVSERFELIPRKAQSLQYRCLSPNHSVRFPELTPYLPPERKPWISEDLRIAIFDAAAFALAFSGTAHWGCAGEGSPNPSSHTLERAAPGEKLPKHEVARG